MRGHWIFWQGSQAPFRTGGALPSFVMHIRPGRVRAERAPPRRPGFTGVAVNANARRLDGEAWPSRSPPGPPRGPRGTRGVAETRLQPGVGRVEERRRARVEARDALGGIGQAGDLVEERAVRGRVLLLGEDDVLTVATTVLSRRRIWSASSSVLGGRTSGGAAAPRAGFRERPRQSPRDVLRRGDYFQHSTRSRADAAAHPLALPWNPDGQAPAFRFHPAVHEWFAETFPAPTRAQELGWPEIQAGASTLVFAPTGSGKTLAAFLAAIDRLMFAPVAAEARALPGALRVAAARAGRRRRAQPARAHRGHRAHRRPARPTTTTCPTWASAPATRPRPSAPHPAPSARRAHHDAGVALPAAAPRARGTS
jgi:hypothetical protein